MKTLPDLRLTKKPRYKNANECPCGKSNKDGKFTPYEIAGKTDSRYGFCHSCGENIKPPLPEKEHEWTPPKARPPVKKKKELKYVDIDIVKATMKAYDKNNFIVWLHSLVGLEKTKEAIKRFNIGTAKGNKTAFWYQNKNGQYMNAKLFMYDAKTGKRNKNFNKYQYTSSEGYGNCLFGEHQLKGKSNVKVAIVESEKTAIVMSLLKQEFIWIACGGATGLTENKAKTLKGFDVYLFCDCDEAGRKNFSKYAEELNARFKDLYPEIDNGNDLCDFVIEAYSKDQNGFFCPEGYPMMWD